MCFYKRTTEQVAKKADRDIYGVKVLVKHQGVWRSPYMGTKWVIGKRKSATNFDTTRMDYNTVNEGLHCYRSLDAAVNHVSGSTVEKIFVAKIPKGAMYYENDTELCANRMEVMYQIRTPKKRK